MKSHRKNKIKKNGISDLSLIHLYGKTSINFVNPLKYYAKQLKTSKSLNPIKMLCKTIKNFKESLTNCLIKKITLRAVTILIYHI